MYRPVLVLAVLVATTGTTSAQSFGTFVWQTQPFCNRVTLALTNAPGGFTVVGTDDGCGAPKASSVTGTIVLNADATASVRLNVAPPDGGRSVELSATVSTSNGSGTWSDAFGQSGTFARGGTSAGGSVRPITPVLIDVADNPLTQADPCRPQNGRQEMVLCGTLGAYWRNGALGLPGVQIWRDANGRVHIRGSVTHTTAIGANVGNGSTFRLPPAFVPSRSLYLSAITTSNTGGSTSGSVLVLIYGRDIPDQAGVVSAFQPSVPAHQSVHFGELVFTVDR